MAGSQHIEVVKSTRPNLLSYFPRLGLTNTWILMQAHGSCDCMLDSSGSSRVNRKHDLTTNRRSVFLLLLLLLHTWQAPVAAAYFAGSCCCSGCERRSTEDTDTLKESRRGLSGTPEGKTLLLCAFIKPRVYYRIEACVRSSLCALPADRRLWRV